MKLMSMGLTASPEASAILVHVDALPSGSGILHPCKGGLRLLFSSVPKPSHHFLSSIHAFGPRCPTDSQQSDGVAEFHSGDGSNALAS